MSDAPDGHTHAHEHEHEHVAPSRPLFRFEGFADAVAAKAAFEDVYPIGSSIENAVRALVEMGVQCKIVKQGVVACRYVEGGDVLVKAVWTTALQYDSEKTIRNVVISCQLVGS